MSEHPGIWQDPRALPVVFPYGRVKTLVAHTHEPLDYCFFLVKQHEARWIVTGQEDLFRFLKVDEQMRKQILQCIYQSGGSSIGSIHIEAIMYTHNHVLY